MASSDGKTENKLICFRDGTYIELIAFINDDPNKRRGHWWDTEFGIVDFAFTHPTGNAMIHYSELQERLKKLDLGDGAVEVEYDKPEAGARIKPDGHEIKWEVTFPIVTTGYQRGELPFFTHDVTPRSLRVPFSEESVTHPSAALGVKSLSVFVQKSKVSTLVKAYSAILGVSNMASKEDFQNVGVFEVKSLKEVEGGQKTIFSLHTPSESQLEAMEKRAGSMLSDLILGTAAASGNTEVPKRIDDGDGGIGGVFLEPY
jgi:Glyoxalase-like domain